MEEKDKKRFGTIMNAFAENFSQPTNSVKNRLYFSFLKKYSIESIEKAAAEIIGGRRSRKISCFPTIGEIVEKLEPSEDEVRLKALESWNEALRLLSYPDDMRKPQDPLTEKAVALAFGGWDSFGKTNPERESFDRNHFLKCYMSLYEQQQKQLEGRVFDQLAENRERLKKLEEEE